MDGMLLHFPYLKNLMCSSFNMKQLNLCINKTTIKYLCYFRLSALTLPRFIHLHTSDVRFDDVHSAGNKLELEQAVCPLCQFLLAIRWFYWAITTSFLLSRPICRVFESFQDFRHQLTCWNSEETALLHAKHTWLHEVYECLFCKERNFLII